MVSLWDRELKFINLMVEMEKTGVLLDKKFSRNELAIGESRMYTIQAELNANPSSPKDLHRLLINEMKLPVVKTTDTGRPSFDKSAMEVYDQMLEHVDSDIGKKVLEYRGWQKTTSSNYSPYLELVSKVDGRLRPNYKLHGARTGRMSCEKPNLQQIPRESPKRWNGGLKRAFIPKPGFILVNVDYSQLEFRLAAATGQQKNLIEAFNDKSRDVFTEMSETLGKPRQDCKTFTYAKLFGAKERKLAYILGISLAEGKKFYNDWEALYPDLVEVSKEIEAIAKRRLRAGDSYIKYWTGRRRHFNEMYECSKAFNSYIQGGGAEIVKSAMLRVKERVANNPDCQMVLQVHDSITCEVREDMVLDYSRLIMAEMERVEEEKDFGVKFYVAPEIWGDKEKTKELFG